MASYRLIDEMPGRKQQRPPYSPLGLFFLTCLFLPAAAPFWLINWGRLGHPERRLLSGLGAVVAFVVPIALWFLKRDIDVEMLRSIKTMALFLYGYFHYFGQRRLYGEHLIRGGQKAPTWPLWIAAVLAAGWQLSLNWSG